MQAKTKKRQVLFAIESLEHFQEKISAENKKLVCIETHLSWCGRCEHMEQNYRSLFMKFDEDFLRMEFFSASEEMIPEEILAGLSCGPLTCKPRFLIFSEGEKKDEIEGADYSRLEVSIGKNIPTFDD